METLKTIQEYMEKNEKVYLNVLYEIKKEWWSFSQTQEGRRSIYRVISRGNYNDSELKSPEKVLEKIERKRKEENPAYEISLVEDIIGIRIVCIDLSGVERVKQYIQTLLTEEGSKFSEAEEKERETEIKMNEEWIKTGYYAWHVMMRMHGYAHVPCEIQIMTMLQEVWCVKTHDLIYKPAVDIKESHVRQSKLLSDTLRVVEQQSNLLEDAILEKHREERRRRNMSMGNLLEMIISEHKNKIDSEILKRIETINKQKKVGLNAFEELLEDLQNKVTYKNLTVTLANIIIYLAVKAQTSKHITWVLSLIDAVLIRSEDKAKGQWHVRKAFALWVFNQKACAEEAGKAVELAEMAGDEKTIIKAKNDVAYFASDLGITEKAKIALKYSEENHKSRVRFKKILSPFEISQIEETYGYVRIAFGGNPKEILSGWKICQRVWKNNQEIQNVFALYDQQKVLTRLQEFSRGDVLLEW